MIRDPSIIMALDPTEYQITHSSGAGPHWVWWVVAFLIFWPSLIVLFVYHILYKKHYVILKDSRGGILYEGYISENARQFIVGRIPYVNS